MRFAHLADCHIGSWRDPKLKDASTKAFKKAIDSCIFNNVDFILIAGDLFNTALPSIDLLKEIVDKFRQLKEKDIPIYMIPGSHDFSPSGKSMLEVLEKAGLITNVSKAKKSKNYNDKISLKLTIDKKTGTKITGLLGKKGGLEKEYYKNLDNSEIEKEKGYKIFLFHTLLSELKPEELKEVESYPISYLPKGFDYYAGGHPHIIKEKDIEGYGAIAYPGPLFPNSFSELEKLKRGGFYIINVEGIEIENKKEILTSIKWEPIQIFNTYSIDINADNKTPEQIEEDIYDNIKNKEFNNTIITLRIHGILKSQRPSDINFKEIYKRLYNKSAYTILKNTSKLTSKEFEQINIKTSTVKDIEEDIIKEHIGKIKINDMNLEKEKEITKELIKILSSEKQEGETNSTFEDRILSESDKILDIN